MENTAKKILKQIETLKAEKTEQLETIFEKAQQAGRDAEKAAEDMKKAAETLDLDAYQEAKNAEERAKIAAQMYGERYAALEAREFLSEAESDQTIDSLKRYEEDLAADYEKKIVTPISALNRIHMDYIDAVQETETAIREWTLNIHRNYRAEGTTYKDGTNRSPKPIPVRNIPYEGSELSKKIGNFLNNIKSNSPGGS